MVSKRKRELIYNLYMKPSGKALLKLSKGGIRYGFLGSYKKSYDGLKNSPQEYTSK